MAFLYTLEAASRAFIISVSGAQKLLLNTALTLAFRRWPGLAYRARCDSGSALDSIDAGGTDIALRKDTRQYAASTRPLCRIDTRRSVSRTVGVELMNAHGTKEISICSATFEAVDEEKCRAAHSALL